MMGLSVYAAIAGGLFISLRKHPGVALAGVLCMFGLEQWGQATTIFFAQHQTATNYLIGGILLLGLLVQAAKKGFSLFEGYPAVGWVILALFFYAFTSAQWSTRMDLSMDMWASHWPYVVTFVILSPLIITQSGDLRDANIALLVMGGALTILLLFLVNWEFRVIVLESGMGNPLAVSAMAGMVVLIAILADPWPDSKLWFPIKWGLIGLCLALVVRSGSRGQLLGTILISITCWPISRRLNNVKQFVILGVVVGFLGIATNWALQEFWTQQDYGGRPSRWSEQSVTADFSSRLKNAVHLVDLAYASPGTFLFGLGNSTSYDPRVLGIYPHFVPLEVLAEEGLIGFGLYLTILFCSIRSCIRCFRILADMPRERLLLGGLAGLYMFTLLLSLKQGSLLGNLEFFMVAIILGRYECLLSRSQKQTEAEEGRLIEFRPALQTK
ncbi:MAG: hypothetical protein R3B95_19695 [Nitrospirales bacterium]|nr:hypothetical protein [Nitrospirales bacterium]